VTCILCGCTDSNHCLDSTGKACAWVEVASGITEINGGGCCTFCAERELEEYGDADFLLRIRQALERGYHRTCDGGTRIVTPGARKAGA
jgi:hypothetical protein